MSERLTNLEREWIENLGADSTTQAAADRLLALYDAQAATLERVRAEFDSGEPLEEWAAISCGATCFRIRDALSSHPTPQPDAEVTALRATLERVRGIVRRTDGIVLAEGRVALNASEAHTAYHRIRDALSSHPTPSPDPREGGMNWSQVAPRVAQVTGDTPEQVRAKGAAMAAEWAATAPDPRDATIARLRKDLEWQAACTKALLESQKRLSEHAEAAEPRVRELEAALQEGEAMWLKQAATIARLRMTLDSESAVCAAELARRAAEGSVTPATPEHCCGLSGFNPMLGDECPACRYWARRAAEGGK
jgi:hypothetical protein